MKITHSLIVGLLALGLGSCGSQDSDNPGEATQTPNVRPDAGDTDAGHTGPLRWTTPEGWTEVPPANQMRFKQFTIPGEGEGTHDVVINHWPTGVGGLEANIARWRGEVSVPEGGEEPSVTTESVHGLTITLLNGKGQYVDMQGNATPGAQVLAAYIESPAARFTGVYTVKLTGPAAYVGAHEEAFRQFVLGL